MLEIGVLTLGVLFLALLALEPLLIKRLRTSFDHVIHVAGTRGKTTVTRLIGAALRSQGIATFTKVTGTLPAYIDPEGVEHSIGRMGEANIREQIKMMRLARTQKARVLVVESMAIRKEYAVISQHGMLKADHVVFTNFRADHLEEDDATNGDALNVLKSMIPLNGHVHIRGQDEPVFAAHTAAVGATLNTAPDFAGDQTIDYYPDNIALALSVVQALGISSEKALEGMRHTVPDIGRLSLHTYGETTFINAFAINDIDSIRETYQTLSMHPLVKGKPITVLINNRIDRPKRAMQHCAWLKTLSLKRVLVAGPFYFRFKRALSCDVVRFDAVSDLDDECVFAIGNMKGPGLDVLKHVRAEGDAHHG